MPNYVSTRRFESKSLPGVFITLKKTNERRRAQLLRTLAPKFERLRELTKKFAEFQEQATPVFEGEDENGKPKPKMNPHTGEQVKEFKGDLSLQVDALLNEKEAFETLEVNPEYVRWGVSSIDGLEIDGRPATIEDLFADDFPDGIVTEIMDVIMGKIDLSADQKKASFSPIDYAEASPDAIPPSNATTAEPTEAITTSETAQSTSQS